MSAVIAMVSLLIATPLLDVQWDPESARTGRMLVVDARVAASMAPIKRIEISLDDKRGVAMPASKDGRRYRLLAPIEIEHGTTEPMTLTINALLVDGEQVQWQKPVAIGEGNYDKRNITVGKKFTSPSKLQKKRAARESKELAAVLDTISPERLWRGSWARPTAGIETSPFGTLRTYNKKRRSRHMGLDLDGDTGDAIVAGNRGRVLMAVDRFYSGGTVVLDHGQGLITMAFHMSRIDVVAGQLVDKGELLGAIGASGQVTGPHLHFTVKLDGVSVDPKQLLALDLSADADDDKAAPLLTPAAHGPQPKPSPSPGQPPIAVPPPSSASSESSKTSVRNK